MERIASSLWVTLRRPKAMVTQSKWLSGKGSFSASAWTKLTLPETPLSSSLSRPTLSIEALMSASTTSPVGPTRRENCRVRSPVPPAMSSTRFPLRTPDSSMVNRFHRRWMPPDIRSFIRSYLAATEWNTSATFFAFWLSGTFW